jgi:acetyl-CoA carboxylase biotin carboxyl carrier protein
MDLPRIKALIELLHDSRLTALELSEDGDSIRLERNPQGSVPAPTVSAPSTASAAPLSAAQNAVLPAPAPKAASAPSHIVKAPMQGILHLTPAPDEAPFVSVGDRVEAEQVICVIEAMKMFNTLETEVAGRIVEILAQPGSEVKAGQPLFRIE